MADNVYQELANKLGIPLDKVKLALDQEVQEGKLFITTQGDPVGDALIGVAKLGNYFNGKLPFAELPQALGSVFDGIAAKEGFQDIPPAQVPARPKVDGLPEAIGSVLGTCRDFPPQMYNAQIDQPTLSAQSSQIVARRSVLDEVIGFSDLITDNLAVVEREAADALFIGYGKVRDAALANHKFGESLGPMEDYQYGPAKQAVQTRTQTGRVRRAVAAALPQSVFVQGQEQGRKEAIEQFTALLSDPPGGTGTVAQAPASAAAPVQTGPAPATTSTSSQTSTRTSPKRG